MPKSGQDWDPAFLLGHPLFSLWEPLAQGFRQPDWPDPAQYTEVLERWSIRASPELPPLRFRELPKKPRRAKRQSIDLGALYDGSIALRGEIPCLSASYHDLFNALVFCAFPRSKRRLHLRQFDAQRAWLAASNALSAGPQLPGRRTREQDALTIFDEGGTVILLSRAGYETWIGRGEARELPSNSLTEGLPVLFGHALLEHLLEGQANLRSSAVVLVVEEDDLPSDSASPDPLMLLDLADRKLAHRLADPTEFRCPGADAIFQHEASGRCLLGPPKPDWHLPFPGRSLPPSRAEAD